MQQLLEILTSLLDLDSNQNFQKYKKAILGAVSLLVGFALAGPVEGLRVLKALSVDAPAGVDIFVSALFLSAGTEGSNSVMKFLKYTKEDKKNTAASNDPANAAALAKMNSQ
ncbi:MAG: hypothetical protein ACLP59_00075 [Bryobacteraceae bacterium]